MNKRTLLYLATLFVAILAYLSGLGVGAATPYSAVWYVSCISMFIDGVMAGICINRAIK